MKIEWLNPELTEARVTRGWWRWKQQAIVQMHEPGGLRSCPHVDFIEGNRALAGMMCTVCCAIFGCLTSPAWQPVSAIPAAKVVRRG